MLLQDMKINQDQFDELARLMDGGVRSYSGRAMYGSQCIGYVPGRYAQGRPDLFAVHIAMMIAKADNNGAEPDVYDLMDALDELGPASVDSMGMSSIYYYPNIELEEGVSE
ncbi:hypothetical protein [Mycolicibacterium sp.]|uniref:hypothetical protein n=1 Tax=Mycolicibacterium sp. TaxID=2320850 RepID=UPI0037C625E3